MLSHPASRSGPDHQAGRHTSDVQLQLPERPQPPERWTTVLARRMFSAQDGRSLSLLVQLPLTWVMLIFWLASLATADGRQAMFYTAFVLVFTLLCLGLLLPWHRLPRNASLAIPVLDFAAVALSGSAVGGYRPENSMLVVFPVVWLAISGASARWTLPVTLLGTALVTVPALLQHLRGSTADQMAFTVLMPMVMTALAAGIHAATANQRAQGRQIRRQQAEMERMLAESRGNEELLRATVEAIDIGVLAIDNTGRTLLRNAQQHRHLGIASAAGDPESTSPPDLLVFGPDGTTPLPPDRHPEARALAGEEFSHQMVWLGRGESQRVVSVTARSMGGTDVRHGAVLAYSDVTDLMDALAAKDQFLSTVTHDLRSPISAILGRADLTLERGGLPERSVRDLKSVIANGERLETMVQDLLLAASGTLRVNQRPVDLHDVVETSVDASAHVAEKTSVALVADVAPSVPACADPVRILQVLDNLVSNAVKYSPVGGRVTVRAHEHADAAVLEVEDTGQGMSEAEVRNVFNRFYRTDRARHSEIPGVGLGLYITKAIVEAHGGTISCRSRPERGSTFTVRLPGAEAMDQAA